MDQDKKLSRKCDLNREKLINPNRPYMEDILASDYSNISKSIRKLPSKNKYQEHHSFYQKYSDLLVQSKSPQWKKKNLVVINQSRDESMHTPNLDALFQDFPENSTDELSHGLQIKKPHKFSSNSMDLKQL